MQSRGPFLQRAKMAAVGAVALVGVVLVVRCGGVWQCTPQTCSDAGADATDDASANDGGDSGADSGDLDAGDAGD